MRKENAIIFDIDGTAIDSPQQKLPTERLLRAVREVEADYFLCAATGRVWTFAEPVLRGLQLRDPCIISAGTQICDPVSGRILWQVNLQSAQLDEAIAIFKQYPDFRCLYNDYDEKAYLEGGIPPKLLDIHEPVYFLEQIFVPEEIAPDIVKKLSRIEGIDCTLVVAQRPGFNDIHVTNRNATKEHAVAKLLELLSVDSANTIGIGDGHNDIHLFNAVRRKVAMGNAVAEVKAAADEIILSVGEDGFAQFLESLAVAAAKE